MICVGAIHLHLHFTQGECVSFLAFLSICLSLAAECTECNNSAPTGRILYYTLSKWWMDGSDGNDGILNWTRDALSECASHSTTLKTITNL